MPRRKRGNRISDPRIREVAGRLCYAAAAEAEGKLYGPISLERALGFTPTARAARQAPPRSDVSVRLKRSLPTRACKKWLKHVPSDQTLDLISETRPRTAQKMRAARDGGLMRAMIVGSSDYRYVAEQMRGLSRPMLENYFGCMALGHCNPIFASRLSAELLRRAMQGGGLKVLIAVISLDRQLIYPCFPTTAKCLDLTFSLAIENSARAHPEVEFAKAALVEAWKYRRPMQAIAPPSVPPRSEPTVLPPRKSS